MSQQVRDRGVEIADVETDMVAADVAVLRKRFLLILDVIFEQFDRRTVRAFQHPQLVDPRPRIHAKMSLHPVIVRRRKDPPRT